MDAERLARLERLADRQDVVDCLTRFSRGIDRFDRGPVELCDWSFALHDMGQVATHHNLLNITCEIDGDTAHTETYYLFVGRNRDDSNWIAGGRYIDRLERRGGAWRIALRTNAIEWSGVVPTMPIPFADVPDIHVNGAPSRSKSDPSYQRPLVNRRDKNVPPLG
jgi:hypothetical protein